MCGIVGYIGEDNAKDIIIKGLKTLEYRGYDSSGLALIYDGEILIYREVGRIINLEKASVDAPAAKIGIGHTRWATHGKPSKENSHPHTSMNNIITLVHNGVIENYLELKGELEAKGYTFKSETDTEVIANLLEDEYLKTKDMKKALVTMIERLDGSYALGIINKDKQDTLYCARNKTPMLAGVGEGFNMIGSDALAMIDKTDTFYEINDLEFLELTRDAINIFDQKGNKVSRDTFKSSLNAFDIDLGLHEHYMMKEIDEQPGVIRTLLAQYLNDGKTTIDSVLLKELEKADRLYIVASGTSMHAGLVGKYLIETLANKPVEVHIGSEFGYHFPLVSDNPFFIFISQSGETADSRVALQEVKKHNYQTLTITNVEGSTLSREADHTLLLHAGPEIAVASTKAYVAQVTMLALLANELTADKLNLEKEMNQVISAIEDVIERRLEIKKLVENKIIHSRNCFYLGRGLDYCIALEAALKLKEISYIQTEGYPAGELKHGTIALIEKDTPVIGLISQSKIALNTRSALQEVKAREALVTIFSQRDLEKDGDDFVIKKTNELLSPLPMVVVAQLVAYYAAMIKDLDIDKPRNLAKSVTVE